MKDAEVAVEVAKLEAERQKHLASPAQEAKAEKMNKAMEMFDYKVAQILLTRSELGSRKNAF